MKKNYSSNETKVWGWVKMYHINTLPMVIKYRCENQLEVGNDNV